MAPFGSEEWLALLVALAADLAPAPGVDVVVQFEVSSGGSSRSAKNTTRFWVALVGGAPTVAGAGRHPDATVTVACTTHDGLALLRGDLDADVAFMQGRLKVDGAYEQFLFERRDVLGADDHRSYRAAVAAATEL